MTLKFVGVLRVRTQAGPLRVLAEIDLMANPVEDRLVAESIVECAAINEDIQLLRIALENLYGPKVIISTEIKAIRE